MHENSKFQKYYLVKKKSISQIFPIFINDQCTGGAEKQKKLIESGLSQTLINIDNCS